MYLPVPCPTGGCRWQARVGSLHKFLFQGLYQNVGGDRLEGSVWHIHVMLCCLFVCECRKSAVLSMELSSYGLLPPEQCLCMSMGAEHSCWSREYRQAMAGSPIPWPLSQGSRPGMCSSPTGAAKQELSMDTFLSINSSLLLWLWDMWMWFHGVQVYVQNILFHHFCECPDSFLVCAPELLYYWLDVINLPWAKRRIIHINKKGTVFNSNKLSSTIFCLIFDKVTCHALY